MKGKAKEIRTSREALNSKEDRYNVGREIVRESCDPSQSRP